MASRRYCSRHLFAACGFFVLGIGLLPTLAAAKGHASLDQGHMSFAESYFDFGSVYRGTQLSHKFAFTNTGKGSLTIQGVHAACGCTAVEADQNKKYQPGESGTVEVKFDSTSFAGNVAKVVTVMSNEKLLPDRTLTIKAFVKADLEADPPLVDFGDTFSQQGAEQQVHIKPLEGFKLNVKGVSYNTDMLDVAFARDQDPKNPDGWLLTVKLKPNLVPGFLKEQLIVKNNSPHLAELPIPVRANIKGNIEFSPSYLEFGAIAPSESSKRSITMHGVNSFDIVNSKAELIINGKRVEGAEHYVKVDSLPHEKEKKLVAVELKNEAKVSGSVHGKLYFETTDPQQKELAVDFYAFFR